MCCRTCVYPLDMRIASDILYTGQFVPEKGRFNVGPYPTIWKREFPEEGTFVEVTFFNGEAMKLVISPAVDSYDHHLGRRIAASAYFEIAAKYAEKVGGEIIQTASVSGCRVDKENDLLVASYPSHPINFAHICPGFRAVLLGGRYEDE